MSEYLPKSDLIEIIDACLIDLSDEDVQKVLILVTNLLEVQENKKEA